MSEPNDQPPAAAPAEQAQAKASAEAPQAETASERAEGPSLSPEEMAHEIRTLRAELEESQRRSRETQARLIDEHDRLLRTAAEFENAKKRAQKEKEEGRKFATESLLKDFLPVADNLERAMEHANTADAKTVIEGVKLVQKLLETTLARHGVTGFSAMGKPFDPNLHEALMQQEHDAAPGTVVQEMARGYKLHDRLVRPAAVVVARPRAVASTEKPAPTVGENIPQ